MHRCHRHAVLPAIFLCFLAASGAKRAAPQPPPDETRALAEAFARTVAERRVMLTDGTLASLVTLPGEERESRALLTPGRLEEAFATITEAQAWPSTWLVVRDATRATDLLLSIELVEGRVLDPQAVFEAPRREWVSAKEIEAALLASRGDRVARRLDQVVLVEFSTKTVTTYVYDVKPAGKENQGLMAMLPPGTLLRAARTVAGPEGARRTVALVMQEAKFLPSDCSTCEAAVFGHADTGRVLVVLAGEKAIEDQVDLTPLLRGVDGAPLLPRFTCEPGDESPQSAGLPPKERFGERESVTLLDLKDLDGDGQALEFRLPARYLACGKAEWLEIAIDPGSGKLRVKPEETARR